ncbi:hypothetical protein IIB34_07625 [PVC group bacterium]|nr:hypothetical protein [PVC group bacterium]
MAKKSKKKKRKISRRIRIKRRGKTYFVRIDAKGRFMSWVEVGKSIALDKKRKAKHKAKPGQRDRGD